MNKEQKAEIEEFVKSIVSSKLDDYFKGQHEPTLSKTPDEFGFCEDEYEEEHDDELDQVCDEPRQNTTSEVELENEKDILLEISGELSNVDFEKRGNNSCEKDLLRIFKRYMLKHFTPLEMCPDIIKHHIVPFKLFDVLNDNNCKEAVNIFLHYDRDDIAQLKVIEINFEDQQVSNIKTVVIDGSSVDKIRFLMLVLYVFVKRYDNETVPNIFQTYSSILQDSRKIIINLLIKHLLACYMNEEYNDFIKRSFGENENCKEIRSYSSDVSVQNLLYLKTIESEIDTEFTLNIKSDILTGERSYVSSDFDLTVIKKYIDAVGIEHAAVKLHNDFFKSNWYVYNIDPNFVNVLNFEMLYNLRDIIKTAIDASLGSVAYDKFKFVIR